MKQIFILIAVFLFLGIINLPIGYYTFLRILVFIGSGLVLLTEFEKGFNTWVLIFGIIIILFNPFIPVYFHEKSIWISIDILTAIVFIIKSFATNHEG